EPPTKLVAPHVWRQDRPSYEGLLPVGNGLARGPVGPIVAENDTRQSPLESCRYVRKLGLRNDRAGRSGGRRQGTDSRFQVRPPSLRPGRPTPSGEGRHPWPRRPAWQSE